MLDPQRVYLDGSRENKRLEVKCFHHIGAVTLRTRIQRQSVKMSATSREYKSTLFVAARGCDVIVDPQGVYLDGSRENKRLEVKCFHHIGGVILRTQIQRQSVEMSTLRECKSTFFRCREGMRSWTHSGFTLMDQGKTRDWKSNYFHPIGGVILRTRIQRQSVRMSATSREYKGTLFIAARGCDGGPTAGLP
jgi:hypothetical protein